MAGTAWVRAVCLIAAVEIRRSWRSVSPSGRFATLKLLAGVGLLLFYTVGLGGMGYFATQAIEPDSPVRTVGRAGVVALGGFVIFLTVPRTVRKNGYPEMAPGLLTTTAHGRVAIGLLVGEFGRICAIAGIPFLGLSLGIGVGTGSGLAVLAVWGVTMVTIAAGTTAGFTVGLGIKRIGNTSALARRHRSAAVLLFSISLPLLYALLAARRDVARHLATRIEEVPLAWAADWILLFLPGSPGGITTATVGIGMLGAGVIGLLPVASRFAKVAWFTDRPPVDSRGSPRFHTSSFDTGLLRGLPRETQVVALKSIRRAVRAPFTVQYALVGIFPLIGEVQHIAMVGTVPSRVPISIVLIGAWVTGAMFCLNPLGNEAAVRPSTVLSGVDWQPFLHGLTVASLVLVLAPALLLSVTAGLAVPLQPSQFLTLLISTPVLCIGATGLATGAGLKYPRYEPTAIGRNRSVVIPSPWAVLAFTVLLGIVNVPTLLSAIGPSRAVLSTIVGLSEPTIWMAGLLTGSAFTGLIGLLVWRWARRELADWQLP